MCGICGVIDFKPEKQVEKAYIVAMLAHLNHRGPDDEGLFADKNVAFGHRRLSIIDLDGGRQPIFNEDRSVCVIVNGEIYNYRELKEALRRHHTFSTRSDSEVIVHLWEEYGTGCVDHLRGMFAFALYDMKKKAVFMARDRFGQKPLVYACTDEGLFFCSEIYPLSQIAAVDTTLSPSGLDDFLSLHYIPAPETIFNGIKKLEPAHTLRITENGMDVSQYWRPDSRMQSQDTFFEAREKVRSLIQEAVRYRMVADVPVGAFLSGGVDSSLIVAMMRQNEPEADIQTVCIGFDETTYDERRYSQAVAHQFGTRHHVHTVRPDVLKVLPDLVKHYGEPYGDPSAIPTWYLSRVTGEHVKVALSGDGGDEIFAGYNRLDSTTLIDIYQKLPTVMRRKWLEPAVRSLPDISWREGYMSQLKQFMKGASYPPVERLFCRNSVFSPDIKAGLYTQSFKNRIHGQGAVNKLEALYQHFDGFGESERLYRTDLHVFLPDDILAKVDIASMAHGLEVRSPFLDHVLAEYILSLPFDFKYRLFKRKRILKSVGEGFFSTDFLNRKKMGFRIPIGIWFRTTLKKALRESLMESPIFSDSGIFNRETIHGLLDAHLSGRWNHTERLWNLWFLAEWSNQLNINVKIG